MPVHECSTGIFLPGPYMQGVERRQSEAIRSIEEVEKLSHKLWRVRMRFVPCIGENQKVGSDQLEAAVGHRLVDDDLGTSWIENAHAHQICVYVMEAHGSRIGAAYAPELQDIPLSHRRRDIFEALGRIADDLHESICLGLLLSAHLILLGGRDVRMRGLGHGS